MTTPSPLCIEREREGESLYIMTVYDNTVTAENRESHTAVCLYITTVYDNIVTAEI